VASHAKSPKAVQERVATVRRFNRFYTRRIGALDEGHLHSPFSLAAARVIYELANRTTAPTASDIARDLALDAGYLSRLIRDFQRRGLVTRTRSQSDGRESHLRLTAKGRSTFRDLDARAHDDIAALLAPLADRDQRRLVDAVRVVEEVLTPTAPRDTKFVLREPKPGDLGWVVASHGALYHAEYGFDARFEALVARIVADFVDNFDAKRERCWIAERAGENVGSVFVVRHPERKGVAKLRLLLVEPSARGLGIGAQLVDECTRFARDKGYHTLTLWTNSVLRSARRIYEAAGYKLIHEEAHRSWGHELVGQTWELAL
jgi:DNA-binding MarR family transcriptional regulator/GNAT superfamily N-acetyltransferase